jgi:uncharacterized protein (DUF3084 family)
MDMATEFQAFLKRFDAFLLRWDQSLERADEDRRKADEDRRKADEDRRKADEDRRRADEDRRKADQDRLKAEADRRRADRRFEAVMIHLRELMDRSNRREKDLAEGLARVGKRILDSQKEILSAIRALGNGRA